MKAQHTGFLFVREHQQYISIASGLGAKPSHLKLNEAVEMLPGGVLSKPLDSRSFVLWDMAKVLGTVYFALYSTWFIFKGAYSYCPFHFVSSFITSQKQVHIRNATRSLFVTRFVSSLTSIWGFWLKFCDRGYFCFVLLKTSCVPSHKLQKNLIQHSIVCISVESRSGD